MMASTKLHRLRSSCSGLCSVILSSPIGDVEIQSCLKGLHLVKQREADDKTFAPDESCSVEVKSVDGAKMSPPAEQCVEWLQAYFTQGVAKEDIPSLCSSIVNEGSFRSEAWRLLPKAVPLGKRITYLELATLCGNARASRAVGGAMANNPVNLLIPCHRVTPSSGGVGNYIGGSHTKAWLLDFEQRHAV